MVNTVVNNSGMLLGILLWFFLSLPVIYIIRRDPEIDPVSRTIWTIFVFIFSPFSIFLFVIVRIMDKLIKPKQV